MTGIFTTDGEKWHASRQLIRPQFIKDRVSDLAVFEKHLDVLLPMLGGSRAGQTVDAMDLFFKFTLDASTAFLLGHSVNSLENPQDRFADAFAVVQSVQSVIARSGPLNRFVPRKAFYASLKIMEEFMQPFIEQTLQFTPEELEKKSKSDEGYNFLYALASFTRDRTVLRDQLAAVLLAGRDTTACTLSWMFSEISRRPDIVAKLRREIEEHVGMENKPTYANLKSMRYLQHVINETLRLYPIVPFNVRVALKDTTLPRGGGPDGTQPIGIPGKKFAHIAPGSIANAHMQPTRPSHTRLCTCNAVKTSTRPPLRNSLTTSALNLIDGMVGTRRCGPVSTRFCDIKQTHADDHCRHSFQRWTTYLYR
jgi:cytochrome P450